ncbi:MAG: double-strand break repair helicase AddA [Hyphomicrobiales bacterium]|nr:double-strand break repair helicase AddA [Hyphomicrobiales bacterium]
MTRPIPARTLEQQRRASDPAASAWVSAHAGSGKTHVLAQRVVRLLLEGVAPARLICLTFTKAAAANMSERVFRTLAKWTLASDDDLRKEIAATGAKPPPDLDIARRLFALAVETPGGLKIQTIHAFCERLLHLFPFEANVPADFRVVEDLERLELLQAARDEALREAPRRSDLADALARVSRETSDGGFQKALDGLLDKREMLEEPDVRIARLRVVLALEESDTEDAIISRMIEGGFHYREWTALADTLACGGKTDVKTAATLRSAAQAAPDPACIDAYLSLFFTQKGDLRQAVATGAVEKIAPGLPARLKAEGERLAVLGEKLACAQTLARTRALMLLVADILDRYARIKRARSLLDFEDLIAGARRLLGADGAPTWVHYKLDGGVDHILVDEAQDTSEAQWDILGKLASEFLAGAGANPRMRTFFAVGDEKQSIFSFQGAAPHEFDKMRRFFQQRARAAGQEFHPVALDYSFRSAVNVLEAVDAVFSHEDNRRGLTSSPDAALRHFPIKSDVAGMVEIWRPIVAGKAEESEAWTLPLDLLRESDPPVELARRIARKIKSLVAPDSRERIAGAAPGALRPITPGDVMILVRRRGDFFEAMVRALKEERVPVAGADRLDVGRHIAVMDMMAAARTALLPDDDLALACVLKSPLCGLDDDDLIAITEGRKDSLWRALARSADARHRAAAARIEGWREHAQGARPFDFFTRLLGAEGGRRAFLARIGPEANDALDELLALALQHERQEAPSLAAFAHALETIDLTVKRDMEAAGGLVRVMTAHAAKGLEAPVVFLPDTCAAPGGRHDPQIFALDTPYGRTLAWSARKDDDAAPVAARRAALRTAAEEEYRRLLYVAMTRAEERLYVAGYAGVKGPDAGCWHERILRALRPLCVESDDPDISDAKLWRLGAAQLGDAAVKPAPPASPEIPLWLRTPAPREVAPPPPLRPSSALAGADAIDRNAGAAGVGAQAVARGLLAHALLQSLPDVDAARRLATAHRYIRARAPGFAPAEAESLAHEIVAVLQAPECAPLFSARSRAEVAIAANVDGAAKRSFDIAGRIDRLAEVGDEIWIADFKTGAPAQTAPQAYVAQLALYRAAVAGLYPGRAVRAFILWTAAPRLDEIDAATLDAALASL